VNIGQLQHRKEAEAFSAKLEPWRTEFSQPPADAVAIGNEWTRRLFDGDFYLSPPPSTDLPSTSLVFVQSREGNTVAKNPSELGGGKTDKHLIYEGLSRVAADAVLAGAETIRDSRLILSVWHPELVALRQSLGLPRHPLQIVATLRGVDFDNTLMFNVPDLRVILLTVPQCSDSMHHALAPRPWITPVIMQRPSDLTLAFRQIAGLGISRISCIGGRTLAGQLLDAGLIQDLYLTKSPKSGGDPNTPLYPRRLDGVPILRKRGTGKDEGVLFEHLRLL
jgi:riboflavin biosynthesis pyrimidine reductase